MARRQLTGQGFLLCLPMLVLLSATCLGAQTGHSPKRQWEIRAGESSSLISGPSETGLYIPQGVEARSVSARVSASLSVWDGVQHHGYGLSLCSQSAPD